MSLKQGACLWGIGRVRLFTAALCCVLGVGASGVCAEEMSAPTADSQAQEAIRGLSSEDEFIRQKSFLQLEALRDPATVAVIRPHADSKDADMRGWSLRALAAIQGIEAIPLLRERAQSDKSPSVRRSALLGLEPLISADKTLVPFFIEKLDERSPEVRMAAIDIVSRIDDPEARAVLRRNAKREAHRDVRKVFALALERIGPAE